MKRIVCLLLALCVAALVLAGCDNGLRPTPSDAPASGVSQGASEDASLPVSSEDPSQAAQPEDPALTAIGCPPLSRDLQVLYQEAYDLYRGFILCSFAFDSTKVYEINGMTFYPITDGRFASYAELRDRLALYFTPSFIDTDLLTADGCVQPNEQGQACVLAAGGGADVTYAGHVFAVDSQTDTQIVLTATAYYAADVYTGQPFYTAPADGSGYTVKTYRFVLTDEGSGFRFSEFAFMQ